MTESAYDFGNDQEFWRITAGSDADFLTLPSSEWPRVPRNGSEAYVNSALGNVLKVNLITAYAVGKMSFHNPDIADVAILAEAENYLSSQDCPIKPGNIVMVNGNGLLYGTKTTEIDDSQVIMISSAVNVFGRVAAPTNGIYPVADYEIIEAADRVSSDVPKVTYDYLSGAGLVLTDVEVCSSAAPGRLLAEFPRMVVPMQAPQLSVHKAILNVRDLD